MSIVFPIANQSQKRLGLTRRKEAQKRLAQMRTDRERLSLSNSLKHLRVHKKKK
jgi:hypothetical protein